VGELRSAVFHRDLVIFRVEFVVVSAAKQGQIVDRC